MVYGGLMGFVSSLCLILLVLGVLAITGIYDRLSIDYRTWRLYIIIAAVIAVIVFVIGAMAFFPYKRKGNNFFKKEYTKGTSYKALHNLLIEQENEKEYLWIKKSGIPFGMPDFCFIVLLDWML